MYFFFVIKVIIILTIFYSELLAADNVDDYKTSPESSIKSEGGNKYFKANKYIAVTADPRATSSAVRILELGGTAIDAAISAQMVLNLVEPQSSGIGGGAFILYYDESSKSLIAWDGREKAPQNYREDIFLNKNGKRKGFLEAVSGGLAVGAPPLVSLLEKTHEEYGSLSWDVLFEDAINYSKEGFVVGERLEKLIKKAPHLKNDLISSSYFGLEEGGLKAGFLKKNMEFAKTLEKISNQGSRAIISGDIMESILKSVKNYIPNPGILEAIDFKNINPLMSSPLCRNYRKWKICGMGPPSSGAITVLQILGILNNFDLTNLHQSDVWHLFIEASKLAYVDRNYYIADTDFVNVPVKEMLSFSYMSKRAKLINKNKILQELMPGKFENFEVTNRGMDTYSEKPSTTHISLVDTFGNAISMTSSIEFMFGSGLMASGFLLNNQMTDFSFYPKDKKGNLIANRPQSGKKPRSSMSPIIVFDSEGKMRMVLGSPGGSRIICYVAASLVRMIDLGVNPKLVTLEPNICNRGSKTTVEEGKIGDLIAESLQLKGHKLSRKSMTSGLHIIYKDHLGQLYGIADQRREGAAYGL